MEGIGGGRVWVGGEERVEVEAVAGWNALVGPEPVEPVGARFLSRSRPEHAGNNKRKNLEKAESA